MAGWRIGVCDPDASMERWTLSESEVVVATRWLTIERNRYQRDGREIGDYHVLRRSPFVVIVAVTKDDDVLLVREYRVATNKTYLAFPAGYIDPDEEPEDAAKRELREETGATGCNWTRVGQLDPDTSTHLRIFSDATFTTCTRTRASSRRAPPTISKS